MKLDNFKILNDLAGIIDACDIVISVEQYHSASGLLALERPRGSYSQHVRLATLGHQKGSQSPLVIIARLFRQPERGNWQSVLDQVSDGSGNSLYRGFRQSAIKPNHSGFPRPPVPPRAGLLSITPGGLPRSGGPPAAGAVLRGTPVDSFGRRSQAQRNQTAGAG